jgi:hypothetical protein
MRDPFEKFLAHFEDVEKTGSGYLVYCPGHNDKHRKSLHVSRGDKVPVVLRCFTGCNNETILAAMGLSMRDLFDEEPEKQKATTITMDSHAAHIGIPKHILVNQFKLRQGPGYISIPSFGTQGELLYERKRFPESARQRFKQPPGVKLRPYGLDRLDFARKRGGLIVVEGECMTGDHEVLTNEGWVRLDETRPDHLVAQWGPSGIDFVPPLRIVEQEWSGMLYQLSTKMNHLSQVVTYNHKLVGWYDKGELTAWEAQDNKVGGRTAIPRAGWCFGEGVEIDWDVVESHLNSARRSAEPIPWSWIVGMTSAQRSAMMDFVEDHCISWRGAEIIRGCSRVFADWVQALYHTSNKSVSVLKESVGDDLEGMLTIKLHRRPAKVLWMRVQRELVESPGSVYCLTVPSGAFLVRHNGVVSVTGNSDHQTLIYNGVPSLGIPGGGGYKCLEAGDISGINDIYVVQEDDDAGTKFVGHMCQRITGDLAHKGNLFVIPFNEVKGAKDPNDLYKQDPNRFKDRFRALCEKAVPWSAKPLNFVFADQIKNKPIDWLWKPYIPFGHSTMIWGKGGLGKSYFTAQIAAAASAGLPMPVTGDVHPEMRVLILSSEDDMEEQLAPHLRNANAKMENVGVWAAGNETASRAREKARGGGGAGASPEEGAALRRERRSDG